MKNPLVSVIIPTLNSEKYLCEVLQSVKDQDYRNIEIIISDGGSEDETEKIARKFGAKVFKSKLGRSTQRNFGAKQARGELIYFIDDDVILDQGIISEAVSLIVQQEFDMVAIHYTSDPSVSFWSKVRKFEKDMLYRDKHNICPRFIRKKVFESVGGFNEKMVAGEDYDLYNRLLARDNKLGFGTYHEVHQGEPKTLGEIIRKHYFYGESVNGLRGIEQDQKPVLTFWQKSPIKYAYFVNFHKILLHPILGFGLLVYNFARYLSGFMGLLMGKVGGGSARDRVFR